MVFARVQPLDPPPRLAGLQGGVEESRRHAAGLQLVNLVFHQGDERGDDQRQAITDQGGQLVAQAFPGTGRKNRHRVASLQRGFHDLTLERPELVVTESLLEAAGQ